MIQHYAGVAGREMGNDAAHSSLDVNGGLLPEGRWSRCSSSGIASGLAVLEVTQ